MQRTVESISYLGGGGGVDRWYPYLHWSSFYLEFFFEAATSKQKCPIKENFGGFNPNISVEGPKIRLKCSKCEA